MELVGLHAAKRLLSDPLRGTQEMSEVHFDSQIAFLHFVTISQLYYFFMITFAATFVDKTTCWNDIDSLSCY